MIYFLFLKLDISCLYPANFACCAVSSSTKVIKSKQITTDEDGFLIAVMLYQVVQK